ncbi:MAG: protein kinase [Clostridiales Family XIII bacterium]|jgi:hypothetical protein|nr:protein kinase [Clostridiales Family XIII bacterium]
MYCFNCFNEIPEGPCPRCGYQNHSNESQYPTALPEGSLLAGQYVVGRVLGQGGFGITYVAFDNKLLRKFAIKEYMPESICTRTPGTAEVSPYSGEKRDSFAYGKQCFLDEARTMATFGNLRGIAAVISFFDENGTSYFVMDYVEGVSLKMHLKNAGGRIPYEEAARILMPVLDTLETVHAQGIIHRDVACDNIYITKDDEIKLLDFGAAQYSLGDKSRSFDALLKPGYTPKEQYMRRSRQGAFTDVYALGACFYSAVTGFLPPESLERMENDEILSISACGFAIPAQAEDAIMKALEVDAADRFQSMAEFRSALTAEGAEEPVANASAGAAASASAATSTGAAGGEPAQTADPGAVPDAVSDTAHDPASDRGVPAPKRKLPLIPIAVAGGGCALALLAVLLIVVLDVFPGQSPASSGSGGGYAGAPGASVSPGAGGRIGAFAEVDDSDNLGSVVYYDGMAYFTKRESYVANTILRISQEEGAVAEKIYQTKDGNEIAGLAVSGGRLYWIENNYEDDWRSWLMRGNGDFSSPERIIELDGISYFKGADKDAVYITNYDSFVTVLNLIRITHQGEVSSVSTPNLYSEYSIANVYRGYIYYTKYDSDDSVSDSYDGTVYLRGLFRKPIDQVFSSGEFENMEEEPVSNEFAPILSGESGGQVMLFCQGNVYLLPNYVSRNLDESKEIGVKSVNLNTLETSAAATVKMNRYTSYAANGDTIYYLDYGNWTANQTDADGDMKKIADIPAENYCEDIMAIGSWLYAVPELYNDTAIRIALDGSGLLETIYSPETPPSGGGGAEDEDLYFVTGYEDYGIYVRSTPSTGTDANKILYIEPGDRSVVMHWLGLTEYHEGHNWYYVQLPDGGTGWVRADVVRIYMRNGERYL